MEVKEEEIVYEQTDKETDILPVEGATLNLISSTQAFKSEIVCTAKLHQSVALSLSNSTVQISEVSIVTMPDVVICMDSFQAGDNQEFLVCLDLSNTYYLVECSSAKILLRNDTANSTYHGILKCLSFTPDEQMFLSAKCYMKQKECLELRTSFVLESLLIVPLPKPASDISIGACEQSKALVTVCMRDATVRVIRIYSNDNLAESSVLTYQMIGEFKPQVTGLHACSIAPIGLQKVIVSSYEYLYLLEQGEVAKDVTGLLSEEYSLVRVVSVKLSENRMAIITLDEGGLLICFDACSLQIGKLKYK